MTKLHTDSSAHTRSPRPRVGAQRRNRMLAMGSIQFTMLAISIVMLYPLYFIIVTALKTHHEYLTNRLLPPVHPTLENFRTVFSGGELLTWLWNSTIITLSSVLTATVIASLAAYPLSRLQFFGRKLYLELNIILMVVPPVVLVVPLFLLFADLNLINSRLSVIIIYIGFLLPFSTFVLANFFATVPRSLDEAAALDGANALQTLIRIFIPISAPAIATIVVVNAVAAWNELLVALVFLQSDNVRTLMAGLTLFQGRYIRNEPLVMTGALIASIPMIALYIVGQRFFIRGLTAGLGK